MGLSQRRRAGQDVVGAIIEMPRLRTDNLPVTPSASQPTVPPLLERMATIRSAVRRAALIRGVALALSALLGMLLGWIAADWVLHLDSGVVRTLAALTVAGIAVAATFRFIVRPWRSPLQDVDLALLVERHTPSLAGELASAVQFSARPSTDKGASVLEQDLVARTEERLAHLPDGEWLDSAALIRSVALAGTVAAAFLGLALAAPRTVATALQRLTLPWAKLEWPRRHTLQFLDADLRPIAATDRWRVAEGEALTLYVADAQEILPAHILLEVRHPDGAVDREELRQATLRDTSGASRQVAVLSLTPTRGPLELTARGGDDDRLPPLRLDVAPPPAIESFEITLTPPAYSEKPMETLAGGVGHIQGLVGTEVSLKAVANTPLSRVVLNRGPRQHEELPLAEDRRTIQTSFAIATADRSSYWFELTDEHGLRHANPPRYEIRGLVDREPQIRIVQPEVDLRVQPDAEIPFALEASDDLGLQRVELIVSIPGSAVPEEVRLLEEFSIGARESRPQSLVKIREFNAMPGTQLAFRGQAVDRFDLDGKAGHVARSGPRLIEIVSIEEKRQELASRQAGVAESLERARTVQSQVQQQVQELQIQWDKTHELRAEDRALLSRLELAQQEVREELSDPRRGAQGRVAELRREAEWNRLDEPAVQGRLDRLEGDLARLATESLPQVDGGLDELRRGAESASPLRPQTGEHLKKTLGAQQDVLDSLASLLGELQEWRTQEDLRRKVGDLAASQKTLSEETQKLGSQTLSRTLSSLTPQEQADVARLADRQARLATDLEAIQRSAAGDSPSTPEPSSPDSPPPPDSEEKQAAETLAGADAAGKLRRAAGLMQENRMQQAAELQQEVLETLTKLDSTLSGDPASDEETLVKRLAAAREEAAGLREQQSLLKRELQSLAPQSAEPMQKEQLESLEKRQENLQKRAAEFSQRLRKRDLSQPAASARRGAERMAAADEALEEEHLPDALQQQGEALEDLQQAERELAALEQQARIDDAIRELQEAGQRAGLLADRQQTLREETGRLETIRVEQGKLSRGQLRTLQQTRESQETLAKEIESLAGLMKDRPVLGLGAALALDAAREAARRLAERTTDGQTQQRQTDVIDQLKQLAQSLAPTNDQPQSPEGAPQENEPKSPGGGTPSAEAAAAVAELRLLKAMQESLLERTTKLLTGKGNTLTPTEDAELKELAARQQKLAGLAEALLKSASDAERGAP